MSFVQGVSKKTSECFSTEFLRSNSFKSDKLWHFWTPHQILSWKLYKINEFNLNLAEKCCVEVKVYQMPSIEFSCIGSWPFYFILFTNNRRGLINVSSKELLSVLHLESTLLTTPRLPLSSIHLRLQLVILLLLVGVALLARPPRPRPCRQEDPEDSLWMFGGVTAEVPS